MVCCALEVHTFYVVVSPKPGGKALESPVVAVHLLMPVLKLSVQSRLSDSRGYPSVHSRTSGGEDGELLVGWLTETPRERDTVSASGGKTAHVGVKCSG